MSGAIDLEALEAAAKAATPGPMYADKSGRHPNNGLWCCYTTVGGSAIRLYTATKADAIYAAAAWDALPALIARVREAEAENERLRGERG